MAPLAFIMAMMRLPNLGKHTPVVSENQLFFFMEHIYNTFGSLCLRKKFRRHL